MSEFNEGKIPPEPTRPTIRPTIHRDGVEKHMRFFDIPEDPARALTARDLALERKSNRLAEIRQELESAREQALVDPLTGAYNRRWLMGDPDAEPRVIGALESSFEQARRLGTSLGVTVIDLDFFKQVNDTAGHSGGDAVLRQTGKRLRDAIRSYDSVARFGGEEFVVLSPSERRPPLDEIYGYVERLRDDFDSQPFTLPDGQQIIVTASLGHAIYPYANAKNGGEHITNSEDLFNAADVAAFQSKATGRNRSTLWTPGYGLTLPQPGDTT